MKFRLIRHAAELRKSSAAVLDGAGAGMLASGLLFWSEDRYGNSASIAD